MGSGFQELPGLGVELERVLYLPELEAPDERPHPFAYFIRIVNDSPRRVTIKARKWIIRDQDGGVLVVEGKGVVGQTPEINPGESFSYNSYHVVSGDSEVSGTFFGQDETGEKVRVGIPAFSLKVPVQD